MQSVVLRRDTTRNKVPVRDLILCFSPESYECPFSGRSSGLSGFGAFPSRFNWNSGEVCQNVYLGLTAAGTAPDLNGVPFSSAISLARFGNLKIRYAILGYFREARKMTY